MSDVKIAAPSVHPNFETLEEALKEYSERELVAMINRFLDQSIRAKKYRTKSQEEAKLLRQNPQVKAAIEAAKAQLREQLENE